MQQDVAHRRLYANDALRHLPATYGWLELAQFAGQHDKDWRRAIKQSCEAVAKRVAVASDQEVFAHKMRGLLELAGVAVVTPVGPAQQSSSALPCQQCGKVFETNQSLSLHRLKVHGEHAAVRAFTYTTHCVVCMVEFHTTHRLQMHLRRTRPCIEFSQRYLVPLEPGQFINVKQGSKFHGHKNVPAIRLAGPRLPTTYEWRESNATDFDPLEPTGLERASPDVPARPHARVRQPCLKTHEGPADPDSPDWHECASPDVPARPHARVRQPCLKTHEGPADPDSPDWHVSLLDAQHDVDRRTKVDVSNFAFLRHPALLRVRQKPTFFVVRLFAGRDRPGSLRAHVQELNQKTDFEVFAICLDVVHDKKLCDLGSPHLVIKLISLAHQGLLLGLDTSGPMRHDRCGLVFSHAPCRA